MDVIDSYCMAFFNHGAAKIVRDLKIDTLFFYHLSVLPDMFSILSPLMADTEQYPWSSHKNLGAVGMLTMGWLSTMDTALKLGAKNQFAAIVKYEDLVLGGVGVLKALLSALVPGGPTSVPGAEGIFEQDAHGPDARTTSMRRKLKSKDPLYISPKDYVGMKALIARHNTIRTPDFTIPNTMKF